MFTFQFSENIKGFNDSEMKDFIEDKEVIEFAEHFFVHEKIPYLTIILSYRDAFYEKEVKRFDSKKIIEELDEKEKVVFEELRAWRATQAISEGIPPYLIAKNKHLSIIIKQKINSKNAIADIRGIGKAKAEKYGDAIIKIVEKSLNFNLNDNNVKCKGSKE